MSNNSVIVENVSKSFTLYHNQQDSLKRRIVGLFDKRYKAVPKHFNALSDINLNVPKGEALGLMGNNGSGKSTLLTLIAGIIPPTNGQIHTFGRLVPMISLGVGFSHELSGYENIFLNASLFGVSNEEIRELLPSIHEFSGLKDFIHEPVKNYSSGMFSRLGFSISIHLNPEILLADEILSVGDHDFQQKCLRKIRDLRENGMTLLFVSHSKSQVKEFCDSYILLEKGEMKESGKTIALLND